MLLDDLGRVLATPMPRSRALRLIGATLFFAAFPRTAAAELSAPPASCADLGCPVPANLCCQDPPKPGRVVSICCGPNQKCCSGLTPRGSAFAMVVCCKPNERCIATDTRVTCGAAPCASGVVCGGTCCQPLQTCLNGRCCFPKRICGNLCCAPDSECTSVRKVGGGIRQVCVRTPCLANCGDKCCPPDTVCVRGGCVDLPRLPGAGAGIPVPH
jgi:hypothetical protein